MHDQNKGEEFMSEYIFKRYEEYRDKCDALTKEISELKATSPHRDEPGMTDYQFKYIMDLKDKCEFLEQKNNAIYQLIKSCVEAGKSPDEILKAIEDWNGSN